jgi:hypothetical protein
MIIGVALSVLYVVAVPETRPGPILAKRAKRLRQETGDDRYFAEQELMGHRTAKQILQETLLRPAGMVRALAFGLCANV